MRNRIWTSLMIAILAVLLLRGCKEEEMGLNTEGATVHAAKASPRTAPFRA